MITAAYVELLFDMNHFFILFSSSLSVFYSAALFSMQLTALQSLTLSVQTDPVFFKASVVVMDTVAS